MDADVHHRRSFGGPSGPVKPNRQASSGAESVGLGSSAAAEKSVAPSSTDGAAKSVGAAPSGDVVSPRRRAQGQVQVRVQVAGASRLAVALSAVPVPGSGAGRGRGAAEDVVVEHRLGRLGSGVARPRPASVGSVGRVAVGGGGVGGGRVAGHRRRDGRERGLVDHLRVGLGLRRISRGAGGRGLLRERVGARGVAARAQVGGLAIEIGGVAALRVRLAHEPDPILESVERLLGGDALVQQLIGALVQRRLKTLGLLEVALVPRDVGLGPFGQLLVDVRHRAVLGGLLAELLGGTRVVGGVGLARLSVEIVGCGAVVGCLLRLVVDLDLGLLDQVRRGVLTLAEVHDLVFELDPFGTAGLLEQVRPEVRGPVGELRDLGCVGRVGCRARPGDPAVPHPYSARDRWCRWVWWAFPLGRCRVARAPPAPRRARRYRDRTRR